MDTLSHPKPIPNLLLTCSLIFARNTTEISPRQCVLQLNVFAAPLPCSQFMQIAPRQLWEFAVTHHWLQVLVMARTSLHLMSLPLSITQSAQLNLVKMRLSLLPLKGLQSAISRVKRYLCVNTKLPGMQQLHKRAALLTSCLKRSSTSQRRSQILSLVA